MQAIAAHKRQLAFIGLCILLFFAAFAITSKQVNAQVGVTITNQIVDPVQVDNFVVDRSAKTGDVGWLVVGSGDFNNRLLAYTFEVPGSGPNSASITFRNPGICTGFNIDQPNNDQNPKTHFWTITDTGAAELFFTDGTPDCSDRTYTINNLRKLADGRWGGIMYVWLETTIPKPGTGGSQQNSFRVEGNTPGMRMGYSDAVLDGYGVSGANYAINLTNTAQTSSPESISDFYLPVALTCSVPQQQTGQIHFFDMDDSSGSNASGLAWNPLQGAGTSWPSVSLTIFAQNRDGTGPWNAVGLYSVTGPGSGNGEDWATPPITLDKNLQYQFRLMNVSRPNAIQFYVTGFKITTQDVTEPCGKPPVGIADSCTLENGNTVIWGWGYDDDDPSTPNVQININGAYKNTFPTNQIYRANDINTYLDTVAAGNNARDGVYGFKAVIPGLLSGGNYTLSGVLENGGGGPNVPLSINASAVGGAPGLPFLAGGGIPDACLQPPPKPTCSLIAPPLSLEPGQTGTVKVTIKNDADPGSQSFGRPGVRLAINIVPYGAGNGITSSPGMPISDAAYSPDPVAPGATAEYNFTVSPTTAGKWTVSANLVSGYIGGDPSCDDAKIVAANLPYLKVYGNDVLAGSGFASPTDGSCTLTNAAKAADAFAFIRADDQGAGAQLGIMALGRIDQFRSSSLRGTPTDITFSNQVNVNTSGLNKQFGGGYDGTLCAANFWRPPGLDEGNGPVNNIDNNNYNGRHFYRQTPGNPPVQLRLNGGIRNKKAIYVLGDVFIDGNNGARKDWVFNTNGWTAGPGGDTIPSFYLIVLGNIYIDKTVETLDGVFIAMPMAGSPTPSGVIYTCADAPGNVPAIDDSNANFFWNDCNRKLTVNGAFIANEVKFLRTPKSLRDAITGEVPSNTNAAEVFNFSPEVYLSRPAILPRQSSSKGDYDSITSLPPIF